MAATTYTARFSAHRAAIKAGHAPEAFECFRAEDGRWGWRLLTQVEEGAEGEPAAPLASEAPAPAEVPADAGGTEGEEGEDDQSMEAIAARNEARRLARGMEAEEGEAGEEAGPTEADAGELPVEDPQDGEVENAEVADLKAVTLAGPGRQEADGPGLDESDPRMGEEYACTFSFPCTPALAREIARIIARKADCPVVVGWVGDFPPGWTQEPGRTKAMRADGPAREPKVPREAGAPKRNGRYEAALAEAQTGKMPSPPDFSAETHKSYRKRLAELVALAAARDVEGLRAYSITATNTSPTMMLRYRDLCIVALEAQAAQRQAA